MNQIHILATAATADTSTNAGYWLILGFFAVIIGISAIAELRGRAWRKANLVALYRERDQVVSFLGEKFDTLDADRDGLITIHDLDDALASNELDPSQTRTVTMLRDHLQTVGHLAKSDYVIVAMPSCGFGMVQGVEVDTYAIGRKDLVLISERLDLATRHMVR
ncbi:MAG: hypothetical protein K2W95_35505 [Candidatus Obscuribacterales bacterium]|nr:hypothetical protein [Candidatus Obscuribacterales bacterium]